MAIKNSRYKVKNDNNSFDVYHFETNQNSVSVLDNNKNEIGKLSDFMFKGKVVESGSITNIKVSGLYKIKNLTGLPDTVNRSQTMILSVKAVGDFNSPEFITYELIDSNGNIFNKSIIGSRETAWTSGGTSLENALKRINTVSGNTNSLATGNKSSLVDAINEVKSSNDSAERQLRQLQQSQYNHNHDERYVRKDVTSSLHADLEINSGFGLKARYGSGYKNLLKTESNSVRVGDSSMSLNLAGSGDLIYSGAKVWTDRNDGQGSGLDADTLDGKHASDFLQVNSTNGTINLMRLNVNGEVSTGDITIKKNMSKLTFKNSDIDSGIGFVKDSTQRKFRLTDFKANRDIMTIREGNDYAEFNRTIMINGFKLYLSKVEPKDDDIPHGSIWIGG
ncbi:hypothetical protein JXA27_06870 [Aerococcaceae bacterium zg-B36]|uniref:hypothetical protein n=1 Tax=Aerococcaceae bacterium zg-252 TaxID=2796928 RepID=UPI001BD87C6D|nr:hypothetical protein [Aerococcaceae bacterium zg-B36]